MNCRLYYLFIFCIIPSLLYGGMIVEPSIGKRLKGDSDIVIDGFKHVYEYGGFDFGFKLGYTEEFGLQAGALINYSSIEMIETTSLNGTSTVDEFSTTLFGGYLGYDYSFGLRFQFAIFQSSYTDVDNINNGDVLRGIGWSSSIGYFYPDYPFVAINLEFRQIVLDVYYNAAAGSESDLNDPYNNSEILISVSFPFKFFTESL